jgi:hypothetical protein
MAGESLIENEGAHGRVVGISDKCLMQLSVNGVYSSRRLIANRELGRQ